jgi:hypothetical protein
MRNFKFLENKVFLICLDCFYLFMCFVFEENFFLQTKFVISKVVVVFVFLKN